MRVLAWLCVIVGVLLAVVSFLGTAQTPTVSPWPSLIVGFCLTLLGVIVLAVQRNLRP
jgi:hypothetical protein